MKIQMKLRHVQFKSFLFSVLVTAVSSHNGVVNWNKSLLKSLHWCLVTVKDILGAFTLVIGLSVDVIVTNACRRRKFYVAICPGSGLIST